ncbi:MAG: hypothetical protein FWB86_14855 [Treponema sp.]|nr:hypothetical protein [Treponema sp.]MCL2252795.1 hypothetical protein [Treponema sp.]
MAEKTTTGAGKTVVKIIKFGSYEWRILDQQKDKVFLLSIDEVLRYFGDSAAKFNEYIKTYNRVFLRKIPAPKGFSLVDDFSDSNNKRRVAIRPASITELAFVALPLE